MTKDDFDLKKTGRFRAITPASSEPVEGDAPQIRSPAREGSGPQSGSGSPQGGSGSPQGGSKTRSGATPQAASDKPTSQAVASRPAPQTPTSDPLFDKRKTQIFLRTHDLNKSSAPDTSAPPASDRASDVQQARPDEEAAHPAEGEDPTDENLECRITGQFFREDLQKD